MEQIPHPASMGTILKLTEGNLGDLYRAVARAQMILIALDGSQPPTEAQDDLVHPTSIVDAIAAKAHLIREATETLHKLLDGIERRVGAFTPSDPVQSIKAARTNM